MGRAKKEKAKALADVASKVTLRPVTHEDEEILLEIYGSTREDELNQTDWNVDQKRIFLRWQLEMQRRDYEHRFPEADYRLILFEGNTAGRLWVGRTPEQIRLLDIAILPAYQNRGIGTYLLRKLIAESKESGKPLRHMIFKLNTGARRFYERLGFRLREDEDMYLLMEHAAANDDAASA